MGCGVNRDVALRQSKHPPSNEGPTTPVHADAVTKCASRLLPQLASAARCSKSVFIQRGSEGRVSSTRRKKLPRHPFHISDGRRARPAAQRRDPSSTWWQPHAKTWILGQDESLQAEAVIDDDPADAQAQRRHLQPSPVRRCPTSAT